MPDLPVEARTAVITGAASGIGRALALEAAGRGMHVAIADIDVAGLAQTAELLAEKQVSVFARSLDVRDAAAVDAFASACFKQLPSVALVWANAGINRHDSAIRPDLAAWKDVIDVNLLGPIHCIAAFIGRLVDQGKPARFVMTGSQASFVTAPQIGAYAASKHGLWAIADTLRLELAQAKSPVGVSLLAPPRTPTGIIGVTTERIRAEGGDAAVARFLAELPSAERIARLATDGAIRGDHLLLPDYEVRDMLRERVADLI